MQTANQHIINKMFLEVNTSSKQKAYYLKDNLNTFLKEEVFPLLEAYFDMLHDKMPLQSIQIEKLNIDFSMPADFDFNTLKIEIINQFQKQIEQQIDKGFPDTTNYNLVPVKEKNINEFFSFLQTGTTSWSALSKDILNLNTENQFEKMISEKAFGLKLKKALENRQSRIRFIKQLSDNQIYSILAKTFLFELNAAEQTTSENSNKIKDTINAVISKSKQGLHQRNLVWDLLISQLLKENESLIQKKLVDLFTSFDVIKKYPSTFVLEIIKKQIVNQSVLEILINLENEVLLIANFLEQKISETPQNKGNNLSESNFTKSQESFVSNDQKTEEINLVFDTNKEIFNNNNNNNNNNKDVKTEEILNSDLLLNEEILAETATDYYVNNAGLILIHPFLKQLFENCKLLHKNNTINDPEVAAHLLHYIATAKEQDYEHEMLFEKFLCNIPANQTINRNITLSEELKNHSNEMLQAVLENWSIIKNSSVALLQNEYLQRPGKIILSEDHPKVIVERKTQDILLDKITWNLGIVKLAWKNKIIFVDW
ncbi:contractile injection system tape measure protein [Flavobacterium pectinovorum]|uniref:contractile injection system tape measure protein n=1 Tax=Flavobacterium pectinovorum TaxID=29533 RepID=UPI00265DEABA|nr:contractile injection system tape measure protein [Flavobacterium pectinovorum]WKL47574.1 contractile injection system tape measure protein [Flavobacterium pectinovorum]